MILYIYSVCAKVDSFDYIFQSDVITTFILPTPVTTRVLRIVVREWYIWPALRVEVYAKCLWMEDFMNETGMGVNGSVVNTGSDWNINNVSSMAGSIAVVGEGRAARLQFINCCSVVRAFRSAYFDISPYVRYVLLRCVACVIQYDDHRLSLMLFCL